MTARRLAGVSWGDDGILFGQPGTGIMRAAHRWEPAMVVALNPTEALGHGPAIAPLLFGLRPLLLTRLAPLWLPLRCLLAPLLRGLLAPLLLTRRWLLTPLLLALLVSTPLLRLPHALGQRLECREGEEQDQTHSEELRQAEEDRDDLAGHEDTTEATPVVRESCEPGDQPKHQREPTDDQRTHNDGASTSTRCPNRPLARRQ